MDWHAFCEILALAHLQPAPTVLTGGSIANTMKGLVSLGVPCALIGNVGLDARGNEIINELQRSGIEIYATRTTTPTSHVISLVTPDGERSFCAYIQAQKETKEADLLPEYFESCELVHIEGYLLANQCVVEKAAQLAKAKGALVSFDVGNSVLAERYRERLWALLSEYVDIVFADIDEACALTHLPPDRACALLGQLCPVAVVKMGADGCYVSSGGQQLHRPAIPTKVVDMTGAGDLFAAGFLCGYLQQAPLERCVLFGNLMWSAAVENYGGEIPLARIKEIITLLHQ